MAETVRLVFDADAKKMVQTIRKLENKVSVLNGKMKKVGANGQSAFGGLAGSLKDMVGSLIGPAGIAVAIGALVANVKAAYEEMKQDHLRFLDATRKNTAGKADFLWNTQGQLKKADAEKMAMDVAKAANVDVETAYKALSSGWSSGARGKNLIDSATYASKLGDLASVDELTPAIVNLTKTLGTGSKEAMGFLAQLGSAANVTNLRSQLNLTAALDAGVAAGDSPEQIAELIATGTHLMGSADKDGRITPNAIINLIKQMQTKDLAPTMGVDSKGKKKLQWSKLEGENTTERLASLQKVFAESSADEQNEIIKKIGGEAKFYGPLRQILGQQKNYLKFKKQAEDTIKGPGDAASMKGVDQFMNDLSTGRDHVSEIANRAEARSARNAATQHTYEASGALSEKMVRQYIADTYTNDLGKRSRFTMGNSWALNWGAKLNGGENEAKYWRGQMEYYTNEKDKQSPEYIALRNDLLKLERQQNIERIRKSGNTKLADEMQSQMDSQVNIARELDAPAQKYAESAKEMKEAAKEMKEAAQIMMQKPKVHIPQQDGIEG